jgi:dTDP-D-glucose 4,6-dehydratase
MPERPGEVNRVAIDPAAAGRDLGWRSATDLGDGLRRTYEGLERG